WGADSLQVGFDRLDLSAFVSGAPITRLRGGFQATGRIQEGVAPSGTLALHLGSGSVGGFALDTARMALSAADSLITADPIVVRWRDGALEGGGSIGWAAPKSGRLAVHLEATQLTPFDSLARAATGWVPDTAAGDQPLAGVGRGDLVLEGSLPELRLQANVALDSVRWLGYRGKALAGQFTWNWREASLAATAAADSFWVRRLVFDSVVAEVRGRSDSLAWAAALSGRDLTRASGGGTFQRLTGEQLLTADSLNLDLLGRRWSLEHELRARIGDQVIALDTVRLVTQDGAGSLQLAGRIPREGPGELSVRALGVELRDVYALAQRDTTGVAGQVAADARLAGTARAPEVRGTASLTGGTFGDFHAPLMRTGFDYRDRRLQANLTLWRAGKPVVEANANLPLDLSLTEVADRTLPGPVDIVARGDSVDLAIIEAFTPNVRQVGGLMDIDARIEGTWEAPRMAGWVRVRGGGASVPGLGVRYEQIAGAVRLAGDSVLSDGLRLSSGLGKLGVRGGLRLTRLTEPAFDLDLTAENFEVIAVPNYMTLRPTGELRLSGTLLHPVLTGQARLDNSVIYFADLVQKEIVNLEDPLFADLIDTLALRRYRLGAAFQSRFLDSLTIRNFDATIGESVWLRSNEANFQLEGSVLVNKVPYRGGVQQVYRVVGNLNVPRGTYTLKAGGVITRTFTVERGTVRYFGDPGDAELDVEAQHIVRAPQGGDNIPVVAHITGTISVPDLRLRTPPGRPPLSEDQLISLLTVGATDPLAVGAVEQQAWAAAANALAAELQRSIISETRFVDVIEIRPPVATGRQAALGTTQIGVGKALTEKLFITANAGFCLRGGQALSARNLGATLEYRFRPELRGQLSAEPVQACLPRGVDIFGVPRRYQFGAELRWNRDF
ncbi:MAG: translocation/assembly module TamB domain-containing protein, partial [Gemmatimonadales bacterium]